MEKVIRDRNYDLDRRRKKPEQFLHLLHGGPGTGKSHVIKILKENLFGEFLQLTEGIDFQVDAFQAVNADNVGGDTLHHALGLTPWGTKRRTGNKPESNKKMAASKRIAQWKWLIVDEISMVSAIFFGRVGYALTSDHDGCKLNEKGYASHRQGFWRNQYLIRW